MGKPANYSFCVSKARKAKKTASDQKKEAFAKDCEDEQKEELQKTWKKRVKEVVEIQWELIGTRWYGYVKNKARYLVTPDGKKYDVTYWPDTHDTHDGYVFVGSFLSEDDGKKAAKFHSMK